MKWKGIKIKELAKQKKITLQKLATIVGVSRQTVNDWINGQIPKGNHLLSLCNIFAVKPDSFFVDTTSDYLKVPVHRTRRGAKITSEMQESAILLLRGYSNLFRNYNKSDILPVIKSHEGSLDDAINIANKLRSMSGVTGKNPISYQHTFKLAVSLGINLIFRYFPTEIKSYAFCTKIHDHRIVFVNNSTNIIDLIFPLLHEFIHAVRNDDEFYTEYEIEEENFCDRVANFIQFPRSYVEMVYGAIKGLKPAYQVNMLKGYGESNSHSLHGIVKSIKIFYPSFNLNVGGADTNLKKRFLTIGDILFLRNNPREYVQRLNSYSSNFLNVLYEQINHITDRKLAFLLGIESVLDAKDIKSEIKHQHLE